MSGAPFGACSGFRAGRIMKQSERLMSLDALRGFDMLFIMGFAGLVTALCKLCPGEFSDWMTAQMGHADWNGFFHHDTIFPLFLFIAGISYPFSLAKQRSLGATQGDLYRKILKRGALLILFGLIYNGLFRLDWPMRTASVLGRIGLAWALAAMLFLNFRTRTRIGIVGAILVGYWALLALVPAPDAPAGADVYSMEGTIVGYIDRLLLPGKLHNKIFDPEGLLSTVPAVATAPTTVPPRMTVTVSVTVTATASKSPASLMSALKKSSFEVCPFGSAFCPIKPDFMAAA